MSGEPQRTGWSACAHHRPPASGSLTAAPGWIRSLREHAVGATTSNFVLLAAELPHVAALGRKAEGYLAGDPNTAMMKLRQFLEAWLLAVGERHSVRRLPREGMLDHLSALRNRDVVPSLILECAHRIRTAGNAAVHEFAGDRRTAVDALKAGRRLANWYLKDVGALLDPPPPFWCPPVAKDPAQAEAERARLLAELAAAEQRLRDHESKLSNALSELQRPRVVFAQAFLNGLAGLEAAVREALHAPLERLRERPRSAEFETFSDVVDDKLHWMSILGDLVIVAAILPDRSMYLCVHVGEMASAEEWALRRRVDVHPVLGSIQVYALPTDEGAGDGELFKHVDDEALVALGVPERQLVAVRSLSDAEAFEAFASSLPPEAHEGLGRVVDGESVDEARVSASLTPMAEPVAAEDFETALQSPMSRRSFNIVHNGADLEAALASPMDQWRLYLHPSQRRSVRIRANGPVRVLGGAGTGKTVALVHRAVFLLRDRLGPDDQMLVTTYTRNLARDIEVSLRALLTPREMERVTVLNLHAWARRWLVAEGERVAIVERPRRAEMWADALRESDGSMSSAFLQEEWDWVVQAQGLTTKREYWYADRGGRGTRMDRRRRSKAWKVLGRFRELLDQEGVHEFPDLVRRVRDRLSASNRHPFRAVLADEVQDLRRVELQLLRALAPTGPDDLFLVGDGHQRIYGPPAPLGKVGIEIRGRSFRLKVNYRTTAAIQRFALAVLDGEDIDDLDDGHDSLAGCRSLRGGERPNVGMFPSRKEERAALVELVRGWLDEVAPESVCVAARRASDLKAYGVALRSAGIPTVTLEDASLDELGSGVRLATMHRLKGTEFRRVALAGVRKGVVPLEEDLAKFGDGASAADHETRERCLFYVAASRARDVLAVSGHGTPSPFLTGRDG